MSTPVMAHARALIAALSICLATLSATATASAALTGPVGLPTVTASATDASASEGNAGDTGTVVLTRTGPTGSALDVN